jgi:hypothetical protein
MSKGREVQRDQRICPRVSIRALPARSAKVSEPKAR